MNGVFAFDAHGIIAAGNLDAVYNIKKRTKKKKRKHMRCHRHHLS